MGSSPGWQQAWYAGLEARSSSGWGWSHSAWSTSKMCTTLIQKMTRWWVCTAALTHRNQSALLNTACSSTSTEMLALNCILFATLWHWTAFCLLLSIQHCFISLLLFDVLFLSLELHCQANNDFKTATAIYMYFIPCFPISLVCWSTIQYHMQKNNRMRKKNSANSQLQQLWHKYSRQKSRAANKIQEEEYQNVQQIKAQTQVRRKGLGSYGHCVCIWTLCSECGGCIALICCKQVHRPPRKGSVEPPLWSCGVP